MDGWMDGPTDGPTYRPTYIHSKLSATKKVFYQHVIALRLISCIILRHFIPTFATNTSFKAVVATPLDSLEEKEKKMIDCYNLLSYLFSPLISRYEFMVSYSGTRSCFQSLRLSIAVAYTVTQ